MKHFYILGLATIINCTWEPDLKAATVVINTEDFEFNPGSFTLNLGDTVKWVWDNSGSDHTTTSTTIPSGAVPWNHAVSSTSQSFTYVPAVEGVYNYFCTLHPVMTGQFTVVGPPGIVPEESPLSQFSIGKNSATNELELIYTIAKSNLLEIRIYDMTGRILFTFGAPVEVDGIYSQKVVVPDLLTGLYVVILETDEGAFSKKIFVE